MLASMGIKSMGNAVLRWTKSIRQNINIIALADVMMFWSNASEGDRIPCPNFVTA